MDAGSPQSAPTNQEHSHDHDHDHDRLDQATWHLRFSVTGPNHSRSLRTWSDAFPPRAVRVPQRPPAGIVA